MTKRSPPSRVSAFPIWRGRDGAGPGLVEITEHPDSGGWWMRRSVPQRLPFMEGGKRVMRDIWVWTGWVPAMEKPEITRERWKLQRPYNAGGMTPRKGRYKKAMLPVELPGIPL